jgi:hypothetical protein
MREQIETEKSIAQLKSFVVGQMKSKAADWESTRRMNYKVEKEGFRSKYIKILRDPKMNNNADPRPYMIYLTNGATDYVYDLKDIGISKMRFFFLMLYVSRFCKKRKEIQKKEAIALNWQSFVRKNKELDRDIKLQNILKED